MPVIFEDELVRMAGRYNRPTKASKVQVEASIVKDGHIQVVKISTEIIISQGSISQNLYVGMPKVSPR